VGDLGSPSTRGFDVTLWLAASPSPWPVAGRMSRTHRRVLRSPFPSRGYLATRPCTGPGPNLVGVTALHLTQLTDAQIRSVEGTKQQRQRGSGGPRRSRRSDPHGVEPTDRSPSADCGARDRRLGIPGSRRPPAVVGTCGPSRPDRSRAPRREDGGATRRRPAGTGRCPRRDEQAALAGLLAKVLGVCIDGCCSQATRRTSGSASSSAGSASGRPAARTARRAPSPWPSTPRVPTTGTRDEPRTERSPEEVFDAPGRNHRTCDAGGTDA
jgi:hypothetical protein